MALSSVRKILVVGFCVFLGACAFKKETTNDKINRLEKKFNGEQSQEKVSLKDSNVKVEFQDAEPGLYTMIVQWPEEVGRMEVSINGEMPKSVVGKNIYTRKVNQGEVYTLSLRAYATAADGERFLSEFEDDFKCYSDFLLTESITLHENTTIDVRRVFFYKDKQLISNGFNLKIKTDQLLVEEKTGVQSGSPFQMANIVTNRTNENIYNSQKVSNIEISSKAATGRLYVALIGLDGADGKDGEVIAKEQNLQTPPQALNGTKGLDAKVSQREPFCSGTGNSDIPCREFKAICERKPTNGQDGQNGMNGIDGTDGQAGGSTGNLKVTVEEHSQFELKIFPQPGKGGRGGKGSPGQLGGKGGAPGNSHSACGKALPGKPGQDGLAGKNGSDGADGTLGNIETNVHFSTN